MLYWLGVYAIVAIVVALPFLFLYAAVGMLWLGLAALRSAANIIVPKGALRWLQILKLHLHHSG